MFAVLNRDDARIQVRRTLGLGTGCVDDDLRFELVRATVWDLQSTGEDVHTAKVINAALTPWRLLSAREDADQETLRTDLRGALSSLVDSGDLNQGLGGHWTPAVTRLVQLEHGGGYLLVGGVPLTLLPIDPKDVLHNGPFRRLDGAGGLLRILPVELLSSWARLPQGPLEEWARELTQTLNRVPYQPSSQDIFDFYLPARAARHAPQFKRWAPLAGELTGTFLSRRKRVFGAKEYRVVDILAGRIVTASEVSAAEARRLMYASDSQVANPVRARCTYPDARTLQVVLASELPRPEQRIFAALGLLTVRADRPWERNWTFHRDHNHALNLLTSLGIDVMTQPTQTFL